MSIRIYNTLTRKKELFEPRDSDKAAIYICGPTVYNYIHIGNARCYVAFDAVVRYLEFSGYQVTYVRNLTDVDDKIIKRALEEATTSSNIASKYTRAFHEDMATLGCREPDIEPTATETIPDMIKMTAGLIEKGFAYEVDGDVFFEVTEFKDYGKLSGRSLEEMRAGERIEIDPRKHHPMDFALWKRAKEGEPSWSSPWGQGRPGWHIECSAMSLSKLGMGFDIHGGGQDLIFPHHENEIAQSEAYTGTRPFVKYWLHNGFVTIKAEKMAKSVGNVTLVHEISRWDQYAGRPLEILNDLRMFFLSTHYRNPIDFSPEYLHEAHNKVQGLVNLRQNIDDLLRRKNSFVQVDAQSGPEMALKQAIADAKTRFNLAMDDDFNTPAAIGALFELEKNINLFIDAHPDRFSLLGKRLLEESRSTLLTLSENVLGLVLPERSSSSVGVYIAGSEESQPETELSASEIEALLEKREQARKNKDYKTADEIRADLDARGVTIEDTPHGARWKWK